MGHFWWFVRENIWRPYLQCITSIIPHPWHPVCFMWYYACCLWLWTVYSLVLINNLLNFKKWHIPLFQVVMAWSSYGLSSQTSALLRMISMKERYQCSNCSVLAAVRLFWELGILYLACKHDPYTFNSYSIPSYSDFILQILFVGYINQVSPPTHAQTQKEEEKEKGKKILVWFLTKHRAGNPYVNSYFSWKTVLSWYLILSRNLESAKNQIYAFSAPASFCKPNSWKARLFSSMENFIYFFYISIDFHLANDFILCLITILFFLSLSSLEKFLYNCLGERHTN